MASARRFTKSHEWVEIAGNLAIVGISDHAQDALGDITFVETPKLGSTVSKGGECGVIESVKAASDLYSPIAGTVAEVNTRLAEAPEIINKEPYGGGWIFKLKDFDEAEVATLMDEQAYRSFLETEK